MKIAITGATGFVGSNLDKLFKENGHETVLISRRLGIDTGDVDKLTQAFQGCDAVAHCAGINREIGQQTYQIVHVDGTKNVLEAAKKAGVPKIVFMSFLRARPNCGSTYHESKWQCEEMIRASDLDYTILKAGVIYGRGDHMLDHLSLAIHTFPVFGLVGFKDKFLRPTAVRDMAGVFFAALTDPRLKNKTVSVVGPEELTLGAAVKRVAKVIGKKRLYIPLPVWMHYILAWIFERTMRVPLAAKAQVRILSEGIVEALPPCDNLPEDLLPKNPFSEDNIRQGLPEPGCFGLKDLRIGKKEYP